MITGGAGFIGSHLVDALLELNNEVVVYDNFDDYYSNKEVNINHNFRKPNFKLIRADIFDRETLLKCMKATDIVIHLAAQPSAEFSMRNPFKTTDVNILGTLNVLDAARIVGVKKLIVTSSSSVYGNPKRLPMDESHPTEPISIYGVSKLAGENYCRIFSRCFGLPIVTLRYFTVYGPRQRPDMAFNKWTKAIFEGKPLVIYGDGQQTRDFTFIDDAIDGTIRAVQADCSEGVTFNIAGGLRTSIYKAAMELMNVSGKNARIVYEPARHADVHDTHADITRAREVLGFNPKTSIEEGLRLFVRWYKNLHKKGTTRPNRNICEGEVEWRK